MSIILRSVNEIARIRAAGVIVAATLVELAGRVAAGIMTAELDEIARVLIVKMGGVPAFKNYKGYPGNICTSLNEQVVHGIPSQRKLRAGELLKLDVGVKMDDYFADAAMSVPVGCIDRKAAKLVESTRRSLERAIDAARAGRRLSDVSAAVQMTVEADGFSVVRAFVGHGIGAKLHEEPEVPNYGAAGHGPKLEAGMVLAIEPMVNAGAYEVEILDDGWTAVTKDRSLSAHFEHTVVIRPDGPAEILTKL